MQHGVDPVLRKRIEIALHVGVEKAFGVLGSVGFSAEKSKAGDRRTTALINGHQHFAIADLLDETRNWIEVHHRQIQSDWREPVAHRPRELLAQAIGVIVTRQRRFAAEKIAMAHEGGYTDILAWRSDVDNRRDAKDYERHGKRRPPTAQMKPCGKASIGFSCRSSPARRNDVFNLAAQCRWYDNFSLRRLDMLFKP